jgi:hypothetical protein
MTSICKDDRVFVPFKLLKVGEQTVLVPDLTMHSYVSSGHNKHKKLALHSGHVSQIYVSSSHTPLELIKQAEEDDSSKFMSLAAKLGHTDPGEFLQTIRASLPKKRKINFDDSDFFESIFGSQ